MADIAGFDARRGWDLFYSATDPVPEPGPHVRSIVAVLHELAGDGPVLELAVGDGRLAIPLAVTGVDVDGIDISPNAIDKIRAHPQGDAVGASVADIGDFSLDRKYSLIFCVANSLFGLTTQEAQVRCFEHVAAHLAPDGVFLLHSSYTPKWFESMRNSQYVEARHFDLKFAWFSALRVDPADQLVYQQDITLTKDGANFFPMVHRYASLGELDLMARMVRLERQDLWGGWAREPYTAESPMFLATYSPRAAR